MRNELAAAFKNYNEISQKLGLLRQRNNDPTLFPSSDHPISQEYRNNYLRMDETRNRFKDCLSQALSEIKVWVDGSNMVFIEWGAGKDQIVVEFSFYGPIVFLSSYTTVTEEITEAINNCLSKNHLIQLNEEEITELNKLGLFNCLF